MQENPGDDAVAREHHVPAARSLLAAARDAMAGHAMKYPTSKTARSQGPKPHLGYPQEFLGALDYAVTTAQRKEHEGALLIFSIDNFAMIISGYGHETGETTMQQLEQEVSDIIGDSDSIHRIQRDQFAIIIHRLAKGEIDYLSKRIVSHIREFGSSTQDSSLHITCSIVTSRFPIEATTAQAALDRCYIALQERIAENALRSYDVTSDHAAYSRQEMSLANYLNKAIRNKRLKMAYQPIIHARTGEVSHYEALLRLRSDDGTISSAGALIPIAERMGLIDTIDDYTLHLIAEELRRDPNVTLAFNISNLTTRSSTWLDTFAELLTETPEIGTRMIVEITETAAQRDLRQTAFFVAEVQSYGAQVALDDFGSGYTSFRQLKSLSIDMVKIDGAFVRDLVDNADNRFFVKTLLDFTNGFGLKSVAEFVESGETAKMLIDLGVEYLQGYYLGRPENHRSWLKDGEYGTE